MLNILRNCILFSLICFSLAQAQSSDIIVGDVGVTKLAWGSQPLDIQLTNTSEYPKFISVKIELNFEDSYLNTGRITRSNYLLMPGEATTIQPEVFIPGGLGKADMTLQLYDVVDTLDELLDYQQFYEQPFKLNLRIPDNAVHYYNQKITFPPRVNTLPFFSSEFSRVFAVMVGEGKTVAEIATINNCDEAYVREVAKPFTAYNFMKKVGDNYALTFPVISEKEAEKARVIAEETADSLAKLLFDNYQGYWRVADSLITAKAIPDDSNDFISGASLVYQPYPVLSALTMWYDLGRHFITRSAPFKNFDGTDICHAANWQYMYAVVGGDYFNGNQFYAYIENKSGIDVLFAEYQPDILCEEDYLNSSPTSTNTRWKYEYPNFPEFFVLDTTVVRPLLDQLSKNTAPLLASTYEKLKANAIEFDHPKCAFSHRYWFWNLVSTLTLNKLVDEYGVERRGKGHYRFDTFNNRG